MATGAPIPMRTDATILLAQWLSPAFPVGAFAYSSGLEAAVSGGLPVDALQDWLADFLVHGTGRSDAILIRASAETDDPAEVDETARAFCASRERLLETESIGRAFCLQLANVWDLPVANLTYPVALGQGLRALDLPVDLAIQMYLHAYVSNMIAAAQRLMPLGHTNGQRILTALTPLCAEVAEETKGLGCDDITSQCFAADIAAMQHEVLSPRIFRT
ncbi:urease accessory protein UreF [Donghicola sp.]|uniref:urease accessory protein UreF n=1 Tax=Donghicola sp. TaxID=1929294 RepID=UPI0025F18B8F|nr:urease accessory UreF family protein [Donghicola sp.]MCT4578425.1 urease accessory protein UreF [Donghicola sp.]